MITMFLTFEHHKKEWLYTECRGVLKSILPTFFLL